jgi:TRAP-type C4-dicarboxylate transport system substrate-binding protein
VSAIRLSLLYYEKLCKKGGKAMKRLIYITLIVMVVFALVPPVIAEDIKVIKMIHADNAPAHAGGNVFLRETWIPKVNAEIAKIGYKLDFTFYHSSSLYKYADQAKALEDGLIDVTTFYLSWESARAPLHMVISNPFMGFSAQSANRIWFELQETIPEFAAEFSKYKEIFHFTMIPTVFNANKVYRVPDDFKGLKVSSTGILAELFKSIGAVPLRLGPPDWYTSLERGLIDVMPTGIYTIVMFKLHEVTKVHIFPTGDNLGWTGVAYLMNRKKYESLPPGVQKVIDDNVRWASRTQTQIDEGNRVKSEEMVKKLGHTMIYLTPEEMELWYAAAKPIKEKWVAEMEAKGLPGRKVYNEAKRLVNKDKK